MRILEFIKQNCENVEFRALGEVCEIKRGRVISKDYLSKHQGSYPVYSSQTANDGIFGLIDTYDFDGDYVTWTTDGQYAGTVFYRTGKFNITNVCGLLKNKIDDLNLKFLYYFLALNAVKHVNKGMGNYKLMSNVIANIKIPLPPMVVQERIVEVLDSFTSLERSLEREKLAREKQYKYYLNHLITNAKNSRILKLGEVAKIITGSTPSKSNAEFYGGEIPFYKPADLNFGYYVENSADKISKKGYEISRKLPEKSILVTCIGATIGKVGFIRKAGICNQQINAVLPNENFIPEYIYFCLISDIFQGYIKKYKTSSTIPILNKTNFEKLEIPLPPLDEQERIVGILDSLNELANGLSAGIPKEIELRQKQYEYWRDRLLEFPSKDSK